ncbi:MAG: hypothetical protein WD607_07155 [Candidatus Paceibacterota bacterium]
MAIQVEQEAKSINWFGIILTTIVVGVVFVGAYFLFFKNPELIQVVVPGNPDNLTQVSQINFNPEELLSSPEFGLLRQYDSGISPPSPGRSNPFESF